MKIDLVSDRALRRPDPVEATQGVFGELTKDEMSTAERARLGVHAPVEDDAGAAKRPPVELEIAPELIPATPPPKEEPKRWSPKQILQRLTKMYKNFTKPSPSAQGSEQGPERGDR